MDSVDKRILGILQKNGRITNAELAKQVGLSSAACHGRVRRLEKSGLIEKYVALLNPRAIGRSQSVFVQITLDSQGSKVLEAFERQIAQSPFVLECHLMTGDYDYLLHLMVRDAQEYESLHHDFLTRLPHVSRLTSGFALRQVRRTTEFPL